MKKSLTLLILCSFIAPGIYSQHCAPIDLLALDKILVERTDSNLRFQFEFLKNGGQTKEAYQVYIIAYLKENKDKITIEKFDEDINHNRLILVEGNLSSIIKKDIIKLGMYSKQKGGYVYSYSSLIGMNKITEQVISQSKFEKKGNYQGEFKVAVFIPFLVDTSYSTDKRLPKDTHECNYAGRSALIFQELDYTFRIYSESKNDKAAINYLIRPIKK